jgi:glutaminase
VHVTLPDGVRLATLTAGMTFGEMALLPQGASEGKRKHHA